MTNFLIEDKKFFLNKNYKTESEYTIDSVPNPYKVVLNDNPDFVNEIKEKLNENQNNILVVDKNIKELYFDKFDIDNNRIFVVEPSEEFKTLTNGVLKLLAFLVERNFTKKETLVVVGGGITEDISAFVGACYKRGIKWVFYPTTLLSMCDSCIGGKTGINYNNAKNQVALFSAPKEVHININFLRTLSDFDIKSGMGEILKLLVTGGKQTLDIYKNAVRNGKVISFEKYKELILSSLAVKRAVVEEDEFEKYYRKSLNYGHTLGHAIEVLSDYKIPHGQAVIIGMLIVNEMAYKRNLLKYDDYIEIQALSKELIEGINLTEFSVDKLENLLKNDKKTEGNEVNFVIITELGNTKYLKLTLDSKLLNEIKMIIKRGF